ncbi:MAG: hypothetical protein WD075_11945 [Rhodospirillales bacterium]
MSEIRDDPDRLRARKKRIYRSVMIFAVLVLIVRGIIFLIDDGYNMSAEEGARLPPVTTPVPNNN